MYVESVSDSTFTSGYIGLYGEDYDYWWDDLDIYTFDNFSVTDDTSRSKIGIPSVPIPLTDPNDFARRSN